MTLLPATHAEEEGRGKGKTTTEYLKSFRIGYIFSLDFLKKDHENENNNHIINNSYTSAYTEERVHARKRRKNV